VLGRSPNGGRDTLFARDIETLHLSASQLVVLSACDTAAGAPQQGAGVLGLARAFLEAGASNVVATLWPEDDRSSRVFFERFHREYLKRRDAAEALRQAQLSFIHSRDAGFRKPSRWSGVVAVHAGAAVRRISDSN